MSDIDIDQIKHALLGTSDGMHNIIERFNLVVTEDELEDLVADTNIERCPECDWWYESFELVNAAGDVVGCADCSPRDADQ